MTSVDDPYLIQPLLYSLANDENEAVRVAAVKALRYFSDEPGVEEVLSNARIHDPSEIVREEIRFSMLSDAEQREDLRATALNTALSDTERSEALTRFFHMSDMAPLPDSELTVAMAELARSAASPRTRLNVWVTMLGSDDPSLVQPLLDTLATDPDKDVRELAACILTDWTAF